MSELTRKQWQRYGMFLPYHDLEWNPDRADPHAWKMVEDYLVDLRGNVRAGRGIMLMGHPGTGKTHMAHIILDAALALGYPAWTGHAISAHGYRDLFARQMNAMDLVRAGTGNREAVEQVMGIETYIRNLLTKFRMVLLDDVGKEYSTSSGYTQTQIERLIRARGNRGKPTIITTNLTAGEWSAAYGEPLWSFLHQVCTIVKVGGSDQRTVGDVGER